MSSSCFSSATILRCAALNRTENAVIFVPAVAQLLFLMNLVAMYWGTGRRKHFLVFADGWAFFAVTLIELLSHIIPSARTSLQVYKMFDVAIGILSFVPILLFSIFLYDLARSYCLPLLPPLLGKLSRYTFLVSIPVTVATNELGSFVGITHRLLQDSQQQSFLAIGFINSGDESIWLVFTSITLTILIVIQAFIFSFALYTIIQILQDRRSGHSSFTRASSSGEYQPPSLQGIAWIALGAKLGAVETLLGFVDGGFAVVMARRILRMLSRGCFAFGVLKSDGDIILQPTGHSRGRSIAQLREMISNPRASTFARLSPTASNFFTLRRATEPDEPTYTAPIHRPQRVTVRYDGDHAPNLNLRLSDLDIPSPEVLTDIFNRRGTLAPSREGSRPPSRSLSAFVPPLVPASFGVPNEFEPVTRRRSLSADEGLGLNSSPPSSKYHPEGSWIRPEHARVLSASSLASDSLSVVHDLAIQFPIIPPRRATSGKYQHRDRRASTTALDQVDEEVSSSKSISRKSEIGHSPGNSLRQKAPPSTYDGDNMKINANFNTPEGSLGRSSSDKSEKSKLSQTNSIRRKAVPVPPPIDSALAQPDAAMRDVRISTGSGSSIVNAPYDDSSNHVAGSLSRILTTTTTSNTPGMTNAGTLPTTAADTPTATDPFRDSDFALRESELYRAESGLGNIAARVAEFDRLRRESYFHGILGPRPSDLTNPFDPEDNRKGKGKERERVTSSGNLPPHSPMTISRPRQLSGSSVASSWTSVNRMPVTIESVRRENRADGGATGGGQSLGVEVSRIKSFGQVSRRQTPTPSTSSFVRQSMRVEQGDLGEFTDSLNSSPREPFPHPHGHHKLRKMQRGSDNFSRSERGISSTTYDSSYVERRTRRESEGEWEM